MPELPEVEALAAYLRERAVGAAVDRVELVGLHALKTYDPPLTALAGRVVADARRHGKFLDVRLDPPTAAETAPADASDEASTDGSGGPDDAKLHLVVHFSRGGWLHYRDPMPAAPRNPGRGPVAMRVRLDDGAGFDLTEQGTTKRLAVHLVTDPAQVPRLAQLGPDPLEIDRATFAARMRSRNAQVKGMLTDQRVLAGIGNAYSDEILHTARLSPFALTGRLTEEQLTGLFEATGRVLGDAVTRSVGQRAATLKAEKRAGLAVHGRTGEPCPVCGDTVREVSFADSGLQYCPSCQTGGRSLADRRLSRLIR